VTRGRRGFSFVELLVVLTVMGVLAGLGMPRYTQMRRKAVARAALGDVLAIRVAAYNYSVARSSWPADVQPGSTPPELVTLLPAGFLFARGSYSLDWESWTVPAGSLKNATETAVVGVAVDSEDAGLVAELRVAATGMPFLVSGSRTTFFLSGVGNY
jgi:prepilin-type N-terminal cleavage/methylation domain-containing protein